MSIARHHADWLSLIEVSGPFVSLPVVQRAFPHGLPDLEPGLISEVRAAYADWQENGSTTAATHAAWVQYVLQRILGFAPELITSGQTLPPGLEARVDTFHETLRPDFAILPPAARDQRRPALLVRVYPPQQRLESPLMGVVWKASPAARMMELLHATDLALGLVTNGEEWQLVFAPKNESTGFASWFADLWLQEPVTLRAFQALLGQQRFFGVADEDTPAALLKASLKDQHEVTDSLGAQVRQAVELLVRDFDRLDIESSRVLLAGLPPAEIYNASLTVMMRLVFLFCAEERGLLRLGEAFYDTHYAVSTLRQQLRDIADQRGEEVLERRSDAWCRLLATFRAVHGGVAHDAMRLPAYGGTLFDPDRYPFLEGRSIGTQWRTVSAQPPQINNRVVLHLLEALQILRTKVPGGGPAEARRLSFRSLDIEQIGHVYEGLLDHTARRAEAISLGLEGSSKVAAPLITLADLEALAAKGNEALVDDLEERTGRSRSALEKTLGLRAATAKGKKKVQTADEPHTLVSSASLLSLDSSFEHSLAVACQHDPRLVTRVRPFAGLLRRDSFDQLVIIQEDSLHIAPGSERRSTGTHYTPRSLTEPIVQHTLEPLVYTGPAEGLSQKEWKLKSPQELLALKVCDMAMGSGAFLVQTCRYLAERLVEAWDAVERNLMAAQLANSQPAPDSDIDIRHPSFVILPDGSLSRGNAAERLLPADSAERIAIARRYVADRCLYGVDINPMAVEMAKLSLWLITLQRDRPFTFIDHALKFGDSLLGVSKLEQIENFSLRPGERQVTFATANLFRYVEEATAKRRALEDLPSNDHTQIETKTRLHAEAEAATAKVKALADALIAFELRGLDGDAYEDQRTDEAEKVQLLMKRDIEAGIETSNSKSQLARASRESLRGRRPFHWAVEFPEVLGRGGFDAFVGNPPFIGGTLATDAFGADYMSLLQKLNQPWHGKADYVVGFFKRAITFMFQEGKMSFVATASLLRGESLDAGLRDLMRQGTKIYAARSAYKWPGTANLDVVNVSLTNKWSGEYLLDGETVEGITEELTSGVPDDLVPFELPNRSLEGFLGVKLCPANREITFAKYREAVTEAPELEHIYVPAIGGDELYDLLDLQLARRSVSPERLTSFIEKRGILSQRGGIIIGQPGTYSHSAPASALGEKLRNTQLAFACGETSTILRFAQVPTQGCILKHKLVVFPAGSWAIFALLQSDIHALWCWRWGLRRKRDLVYSPKRCAFSFPLPQSPVTQLDTTDTELATIGRKYHDFRHHLMLSRQVGLTKTYNLFHDRREQSEDIERLRALHMDMDQAVAAAYGWSDLDLGHGFHSTKQGERYTLSENARRTVLDRLLALNHQRYEEEIKAGLPEKGKAKATSKKVTKPVEHQPGFELKLDFTIVPKEDEWAAIGLPRPKTKEPLLYACSLVETLLSQNNGTLWMQDLQEAYLKVVAPLRLLRDSPTDLKPVVERWAKWWSETEKAQNLHFRPALEQLASEGKISAATSSRRPASFSNPYVIQLNDGLSKPASGALECDVRLVFKIHRPKPVPDDDLLEFTVLSSDRVPSLLVAA